MDWREECRRVHLDGMGTLVQNGRVPFILRVYNSEGVAHSPDLVLPNGVDDVMRELLCTKVYTMFRITALPAALIQSDSWAVNGKKFAAHFGLAASLSPEKYEEEYCRVLNEQFEGTAENLPPDIRSEVIFTYIKGPLVQPVCFMTPYSKDTKGAFKFQETQVMNGGSSALLPDWWNTTIN